MNDILIILAIPLAISFLLSMFITQRMRIISYNGSFYFNQPKDGIVGMEMGGLSLISAKTEDNDGIVAECRMKIFLKID